MVLVTTPPKHPHRPIICRSAAVSTAAETGRRSRSSPPSTVCDLLATVNDQQAEMGVLTAMSEVDARYAPGGR